MKSKRYSKCSTDNSLNRPVEQHDCDINWEGASGWMEAAVALGLCIDLHDNIGYDIYISSIVSDDDSTMRAHIQHAPKGGKLPDNIPAPKFLADPSHRIKVMSSSIFKLAQGESKDSKRCKKIDAMRLKKYIGCFIYQKRDLPNDQFVRKLKAPVEHMFNCHDFCDPEWCWAKQPDDSNWISLQLT